MGTSTAEQFSASSLFLPAGVFAAGMLLAAGFWFALQQSLEQERRTLITYQAEQAQEKLRSRLDDYAEALRQVDAQLNAEAQLNTRSFESVLDRLRFSRQRINIEQFGYARFVPAQSPEESPAQQLQLEYLSDWHPGRPARIADLRLGDDSLRLLQMSHVRQEVILLAPGSLASPKGESRRWLSMARPLHRRAPAQASDEANGEPWGALLLNIPIRLLAERMQPRLDDWAPALRIIDLGESKQIAGGKHIVLHQAGELAGQERRPAEFIQKLDLLGRRWQIEYHYLSPSQSERQHRQQQRNLLLIGGASSVAAALALAYIQRLQRRNQQALRHQQARLRQQTQESFNWRQLVGDINEALLMLDLNGNIIDSNAAASELLGYSGAELLGKTPHALGIYPAQEYADTIDRLSQGASSSENKQISDRQGRPIAVRLRSYPQRDANGQLVGGVQLLTDLRGIANAEQRLQTLQQQWLDFTLLTHDSYWETDAEMRLRHAAGGHLPGTPLDLHRYAGLRHWEIPGFGADAETLASLQSAMAEHRPFDGLRYTISSETAASRDIEISGKPVYDNNGTFTGFRGVARDVTQLLQAETTVRAEKERAQVTLESIGDAVITTDIHGRIDYLNAAAIRMTGWNRDEAIGKPSGFVLKLVDARSHEALPDLAQQVLREQRSIQSSFHTSLIRLDGREFAVEESAAPISYSPHSVQGVVLVLRDVTQSRQLAEQLSYQASHDELTGLPNRRVFEQQLHQLLQSQLEATEHTLLFLDLDQFKIVNDTCGHVAGDQLLKQVASLIRQQLRSNDICARLGGDEFGVLLDSCPQGIALRIADKLRATVGEFRFAWDNKLFHIGLSIGLVSFSPGSSDQTGLLSAADTACYMAKEKGRNRVQIHHRDDAELASRQGEMQWLARINAALKEDRFQLYIQVIAPNRQSKEGLHFEVLVRMVDETGQLIPPGAFIPAAERYNLMAAIDRWIIRHTFEFIDQHRMQLPHIAACSINLSGASMGDADLLAFIQQQLTQQHIEPSSICFEITETAAIANLAQAMQLIHELKQMGCKFALDDFGSGMSSFGYLKHLPVDYLKIDGSFVKHMLDDPIDAAMVTAINDIGHVMGLHTIAEFVENDAIREALTQLGVDYSQGYGIGRPIPAATLLNY